jgi:hypothetical protein
MHIICMRIFQRTCYVWVHAMGEQHLNDVAEALLCADYDGSGARLHSVFCIRARLQEQAHLQEIYK